MQILSSNLLLYDLNDWKIEGIPLRDTLKGEEVDYRQNERMDIEYWRWKGLSREKHRDERYRLKQ